MSLLLSLLFKLTSALTFGDLLAGELSEICQAANLRFLDFDYSAFIEELCVYFFYNVEYPFTLANTVDQDIAARKKELAEEKTQRDQWQIEFDAAPLPKNKAEKQKVYNQCRFNRT